MYKLRRPEATCSAIICSTYWAVLIGLKLIFHKIQLLLLLSHWTGLMSFYQHQNLFSILNWKLFHFFSGHRIVIYHDCNIP